MPENDRSPGRTRTAGRRRRLVAVGAVVGIAACTLAGGGRRPGGGGRDDPLLRPYAAVARAVASSSEQGVVAAGSRGAADTAIAVLAADGNAVDAAVAAAFALGATDPGGSGIGGATMILIRTADGRCAAFDGSPPAPMAARPEVLRRLDDDGELFGHPTVAVPTTVAVLAAALERYGTWSFAEVVTPSVRLAAEGTDMGFTERAFLGDYLDKIVRSSILARHRVRDGRPRPVGTRVRQPELARTLEILARRGPDEFYRGAIAAAIEDDMRRHSGFVTRADLALVGATGQAPVRGRFRGHEVMSIGRPCGGTAVVESLQILDRFERRRLSSPTLDRLALLVDTVRIAQADVDGIGHVAGSADRALEAELLSDLHADRRARLVADHGPVRERDLGGAGLSPGPPAGDGNTTHLSVVDADGTAVALTQSLGRYFGAAVSHPELGITYNCLLEAFDHSDPEHPHHLRPRATAPSATAPTIVVAPDGGLRVALGSAGSDRITSAIVNVVVTMIDGPTSLPEAVAAPRALWTGGVDRRVAVELAPPITREMAEGLAADRDRDLYMLRFPARTIDLVFFGGVNAVGRTTAAGPWIAAADPRRDGAVGAVERRGTDRDEHPFR